MRCGAPNRALYSPSPFPPVFEDLGEKHIGLVRSCIDGAAVSGLR